LQDKPFAARVRQRKCPASNVWKIKFCKSRLIPLHPTAVAALKRYPEIQQIRLGHQRTEAFFLSDRGKPLPYTTVLNTLAGLRRRLAWSGRGG
jgi:integrase